LRRKPNSVTQEGEVERVKQREGERGGAWEQLKGLILPYGKKGAARESRTRVCSKGHRQEKASKSQEVNMATRVAKFKGRLLDKGKFEERERPQGINNEEGKKKPRGTRNRSKLEREKVAERERRPKQESKTQNGR